jgi:catechol 2,3-dioxygenase-like lactoylglutathione lyase family enzyme
MMTVVDVLSSRIIVRPRDLDRSHHFYRDVLGLAVYREFGGPDHPGIVFFLGGGFLEVSGRGLGAPTSDICLWLQVRDLSAQHERLDRLGVDIVVPPTEQPWGLLEMWITDPDGIQIVIVEIPEQHPLRRDTR